MTRRLLSFSVAIVALISSSLVHTVHGAEKKQLRLADIARESTLLWELTGNGRDRLQLVIKNGSAEPVDVTLPAELICSAGNGDRLVTLRATTLSVTPNGTGVADIPAAALSLKSSGGTVAFTPTDAAEPKLSGLLSFVAARNDLPRATVQLAVLALLENVTFADWQRFLNASPSPEHRPTTNVVQAIDALGLLRELAPEGDFALAKDNELKLRALRDPICRTKASRLFGLSEVDPNAGAAQVAPDLKQLLHTQPGDNCPICRMRQQAVRGAGDL